MKSEIQAFNDDVIANGGYLYTQTDRWSAKAATQRAIDLVMSIVDIRDKRVLDMGCGDGLHTFRYFDQGKPKSTVAVDIAKEALRLADSRKAGRKISFEHGDINSLAYPDSSFDLVIIHGVLHHVDRPWHIIREALRLAPEVAVLEPNGNNLGLKVIEKLSPYHRAHHERSYFPLQLRHWVAASDAQVVKEGFAGFVPTFAPQWLAKTMKEVEPRLESIPIVNSLCCAVYAFLARRN